ncbi:putative oxidoreductase [Trichoplax sp. H2]|nr:putative oxidoreductase [Trichoplax sp. H2]|eukprot:RDD43507.1 putative oxidoreductase [Trichoplax sp. H2]
MARLFHINSVLVTGANRGLGLKLVETLLSTKNPPKHVFASYRDVAKTMNLQRLASEHSNLKLIELDTTSDVGIQKAFNAVESNISNDGLDVLVNNAAMFDKSNLYEVTFEKMEYSYRVNAVAPLMMVKAFLPLLEKPKANPINAAILNISSINGSLSNSSPLPDRYPCKCSKIALNMITKTLSIDLKSKNIATMAVNPGWMATDMGGSDAPGLPEESARAIIDLVKQLTIDKSGGFYEINGDIIPWVEVLRILIAETKIKNDNILVYKKERQYARIGNKTLMPGQCCSDSSWNYNALSLAEFFCECLIATNMGGPNALRNPDKSARAIIDLVKRLTMDRNGGYLDIDGEVIPW